MKRLTTAGIILAIVLAAGGGLLIQRVGFVVELSDGSYTSPHLHKLSVGPFATMATTKEQPEDPDVSPVPVVLIDRGIPAIGAVLHGDEAPDSLASGFVDTRGISAIDTAHRVVSKFIDRDVGDIPIRVQLFGGGGSSGLPNALFMLEVEEGPYVSAGTQVAITGALDASGRVKRVSSVPQKTAAAVYAGMDILIVPIVNYATALAIAEGSVTQVHGVSTFGQAVGVLCDTAPASSACDYLATAG